MAAFFVFLPFTIRSRAYQAKLLCLLGITSVLATAYTLLFIPTKKSGPPPSIRLAAAEKDLSPLQRYTPYLNGALSVLILLNGLNWRDRPGAADGLWIVSCLPTGSHSSVTRSTSCLTNMCVVIFVTIMAARQVLVEVNPDELWDLKYELKGA